MDPTDAMFDTSRVLEIAIDMAPADWETLRYQVNSVDDLLGAGCKDGPKPSPYDYFPATITIDGQKVTQVGVRKKGFLGSANAWKPSLKVDFGEYVDGQEFSGIEKLTLNNANQDISLIKQCLAFKVFRDGGVPASRCNFAHLTVNGKDLGIYANVESVSKRMLNRFFADGSGKLYEGQVSDFRAGFSSTYENKDPNDMDRTDIDAVIAALGKSDAEVVSALGALIDLDAFRTFWAAESLLAAWDGYTNNLNNHFVYHDPTTGKMFFLPWGPDLSFGAEDPFHPKDRPQSVSAAASIPGRLYGLPEERALYVEKMNELLAKAWNEKDLLAEINTTENMLLPFIDAAHKDYVKAGIQVVRDFVNDRRGVITAELSPTPPQWPYGLSQSTCFTPVGTISGSFSTTWDTVKVMDAFQTGTGSFDVEKPIGMAVSAVATGSACGIDVSSGLGERIQIQVMGVFPPDQKLRLAAILVSPGEFVPGKTLTFDWQSAFGAAVELDTLQTRLGLFNKGTLTLDAASTEPGGAVTGTFSAELVDFQ